MSTPTALDGSATDPSGPTSAPPTRRSRTTGSLVGLVATYVGVAAAAAAIAYVAFYGVPDWLLVADNTPKKLTLMLVAILLFVAVMTLILGVVERARNLSGNAVAMTFLAPSLIGMAFGLLWPAIDTMRRSVMNPRGTEFVGLDNYVTAFTETQFQIVLRNTAVWVILVPIVSTLIGLIYAVLVDRTRFEKIAKILVFLPMSISLVGASIIWKFMYEYRPVLEGVPLDKQPAQIGLLNQIIVWLGGDPYEFLLNAPQNTMFLIIVMVWIQAGFAMTVLSASIKAIPDEIVEAARLDGLSGTQMFRFITVPSIRPSLVVVLTTIAMGTLKVFDIVRTMTGGNFDTSVVAYEFYRQTFPQQNPAMGSALAVILFILVIPIIVYNVHQLRKSEEIR
jgi:alpha-glucoside transport system permease protein